MSLYHKWHNALPRPVAFVFSGGASHGALQVGMLKALLPTGLEPDLVVGTSAGALNGAVIADRGMQEGTLFLEALWHTLDKQQVFPGGLFAQAWRLWRTRISVFRQNKLTELICRSLTSGRFEDLQLPFGALATELLSYRGTLFTAGELHRPLLASTAIPGVYRPVEINHKQYVDGGLAANVPLYPAVKLGAASLVVFDVGDNCYRERPPQHIADTINYAFNATLRQRVIIEAPTVARTMPVLYLPKPCTVARSMFDFSHATELMAKTEEMVSAFLEDAAVPTAGSMSGSPHQHEQPDPLVIA